MSKKDFLSGLDSLFKHTSEEKEVAVMVKPMPKKAAKRSKVKNFTSDLDLLFQEAMKESIEEKTSDLDNAKRVKSTTKSRMRKRKVLSGLDALIRKTVETSTFELPKSSQKRITFAFDKNKLDKLKSIARLEKSYIKDIINGVLTEYIEKYD